MQTRCQPLLGTFVEVTAPCDAPHAIDAAFAAIAHVQTRMSFHDEHSDLARLRRALVGVAVKVDADTVTVLRMAARLYKASKGLFDVSIGPALVAGGFLPKPAHMSMRQNWGSGADIEIVDAQHIICRKPLLIDLGGIAKGYAVDRAIIAMREAGAVRGLVNAGGDMRMFGDMQWPVALRDSDGAIRQKITMAEGAIASSENRLHRRRFLGRRSTPHIGFDRKPMICKERITIVAQDCAMADAMTKIAMADHMLAQEMLAGQGYILSHAAMEAL